MFVTTLSRIRDLEQKEKVLEICFLEILLFVRPVDHCKANKVNNMMQKFVQKAIGIKMLLPDPFTGVEDGCIELLPDPCTDVVVADG